MKIVLTHPKTASAIGILALQMQKYNPHHEIRLVEVHPKRPDPGQIQKFIEAFEWADIWDCQYWKTGEKLREIFGDRLKEKPCILAHHNPYDLMKQEWDDYTIMAVNNVAMKKVLTQAIHIPLCVDMNVFQFNKDYTERKTVLMVAQRIESSKGIEPVARACKELGYRFILVGDISDTAYFAEVAKNDIVFYQNIDDDQLIDIYKQSAIHVCNSKDNFESGTLPILEAMSMGVPVLTRNIGHVPDLYNERNMVVRDGEVEDFDEIRALLKGMMEDREERLRIREEAWHTVRNYSAERRARTYSSLYYKLGYHNTLVSVVMPVCGHPDTLENTLRALDAQTYPALELVFVSDGDSQFDEMSKTSKHTVKYFRVGEMDKYGLGYARDYGVMESEGEIIVFLDQRFLPDPNMIEELVKALRPKTWVFGNKNNKRNFVENVSAIYRKEFIEMGMSNQLIDGYGAMSQELRSRSKAQGFKHVFIETARAEAQYSSHNYNSKKDEIRRTKEAMWKLGLI